VQRRLGSGSREREREQRGERERVRGEREQRRKRRVVEAGGGLAGEEVLSLEARVWGWAPSGPAGEVCFFLLLFNSEIPFYIAQKFIKNAPKLFINNIFIFRLIIVILFNYYIIY
jgi:hypothetical protein